MRNMSKENLMEMNRACDNYAVRKCVASILYTFVAGFFVYKASDSAFRCGRNSMKGDIAKSMAESYGEPRE